MPKARWLYKIRNLFGYEQKVYKKKKIKNGKVCLVLLIPNAVAFKRGPGMDSVLNVEKWLL